MNVTMPEKLKLSEKQIIIYISIIAFCIISIIIAFYVQFYARIDYMELLGIKSNEYQKKTDEETETLKANFNTIFNIIFQNYLSCFFQYYLSRFFQYYLSSFLSILFINIT